MDHTLLKVAVNEPSEPFHGLKFTIDSEASSSFFSIFSSEKTKLRLSIVEDSLLYDDWRCEVQYIGRRSSDGILTFSNVFQFNVNSKEHDIENLERKLEMFDYDGKASVVLSVKLWGWKEPPKCEDERNEEDNYYEELTEQRFRDSDLASEFGSNCKVYCKDSVKPILVNRDILAGYCTWFQSAFKSAKNPEEFKLDAICEEDFLKFINCLTFPAHPITNLIILPVLALAKKFECRALLRQCEEFLIQRPPGLPSGFEKRVQLADLYDLSRLLTQTLALATRETLIDFLKPQFICQLKRDTMLEIHEKIHQKLQSEVNSQGTSVDYKTDDEKAMDEQIYEDDPRFTDPEKAADLNANLRIYLQDSSDPVLVNRHYLTVYSKVFRSMFEGEFKEKNSDELRIEDITKAEFQEFLKCVYHPAQPVSKSNVAAVLKVADKYEFQHLLDACKKVLKESPPTSASCAHLYIVLADRYRMGDVISDVLEQLVEDTAIELLDPAFTSQLSSETLDSLHSKVFNKQLFRRSRL